MDKNQINRVESPALEVYKIQVSSVFSIMQRITGVILGLFFFLGFFLCSLKELFMSDYYFYFIFFSLLKSKFEYSIFIIYLLNILVICFSYHLVFGIRYLIWDEYGMGSLDLSMMVKVVKLFSLVVLFVYLFLIIVGLRILFL